MGVDGQFPRFFQRTNRHGVPANAMVFNVIFSLLVVLLGGAVQIYSFSNVGYTGSLIMVLVAYYLLRRYRPQVHRPVRLPEPFKYIALVVAFCLFAFWAYGGIQYSILGDTEIYYFLGWAVALAYIPFYLYRTKIEDKRVRQAGEPEPVMPAGAVPSE
jgi:amino acid transporter